METLIKKKKVTIQSKVTLALDAMELNEEMVKKDLVKSIWKEFDYFTTRSLDVFLCKTRKELAPKIFSAKRKGILKRIN